jgi:hypothetical protein
MSGGHKSTGMSHINQVSSGTDYIVASVAMVPLYPMHFVPFVPSVDSVLNPEDAQKAADVAQ